MPRHSLRSPTGGQPLAIERSPFLRICTEADPVESALCFFHVVDTVPDDIQKGHYSLISGYTRENEPRTFLADGSLVVLLLDGGTVGATGLCHRILALFQSLHLEHQLLVGVSNLGEGVFDDQLLNTLTTKLTLLDPGSVNQLS